MIKVTSHICLSGDIGVSGNMYGGALLYLMDEAAAIFAREYTAERFIVSRYFSSVEFRQPVKQGELLNFYAENPVEGRTSFSFDIVVIVNGARRFQASCTFVATDANGGKKMIDWQNAPRLGGVSTLTD